MISLRMKIDEDLRSQKLPRGSESLDIESRVRRSCSVLVRCEKMVIS